MQNSTLIATRKNAGKTQAQVAKESGIDVRVYQNFEYGANKKAIQTAIRIAKAVGVHTFEDFCTLWGGTPIPKL